MLFRIIIKKFIITLLNLLIRSKIIYYLNTKILLVRTYKIISNETSSFTENKNGIFINLNLLNDSTINNIVNYVNMCEENELSNEQEEDIPDNNSIIIDEIDLEDEIEQEPEIDNYTTSEKIVLGRRWSK